MDLFTRKILAFCLRSSASSPSDSISASPSFSACSIFMAFMTRSLGGSPFMTPVSKRDLVSQASINWAPKCSRSVFASLSFCLSLVIDASFLLTSSLRRAISLSWVPFASLRRVWKEREKIIFIIEVKTFSLIL